MINNSYNLKKLLIFVCFILLSNYIVIPSVISATGEDYYADLHISVDNSGFVTIDGVSNYPELLTENTEVYTSKQQSLWFLNISKKEIFSNFIYKLTLPKNSEVSYVKSSGSVIIGEEQGNLVISGFGENKSLSILIQYKIDKSAEFDELFGLDIFSIILITGIILLTFLFIIILYLILRQKKQIILEKTDDNLEISLKGLNDRQKDIINLLINIKKDMTQTDIQRNLNIPKAAVSRNIRRLEIKGLIEKEKKGMSNIIRLKKS